jgi:hypothetical protein
VGLHAAFTSQRRKRGADAALPDHAAFIRVFPGVHASAESCERIAVESADFVAPEPVPFHIWMLAHSEGFVI